MDSRGLHGLSCRKSGPRQQRHSQLNDIIWRALKRAQIPAAKEPINLVRDNNKRPDETTLRKTHGMGRDYQTRMPSHTLAVQQSNQVTHEIGRRITVNTEDNREIVFLFQRLSMALQWGNAVSYQNTMTTEWNVVATVNFVQLQYFRLRLCASGPKKNNNLLQLVPKLVVTLNHLNGVMTVIFRYFSELCHSRWSYSHVVCEQRWPNKCDQRISFSEMYDLWR